MAIGLMGETILNILRVKYVGKGTNVQIVLFFARGTIGTDTAGSIYHLNSGQKFSGAPSANSFLFISPNSYLFIFHLYRKNGSKY